MDLLYISPNTVLELTNYCEGELLSLVINDFMKNGTIILKRNHERPSRWWTITDFIRNSNIESKKILSVILSFAYIGGIVQIDNEKITGNVKLNILLKDLHLISEEDYIYFINAFYYISKGEGVKFS